LVALLAAGAASGCGGDDEPAAQPPGTLPDLTVPQTDEAPPREPQTETNAPAPPEPEPAPAPEPEPEPEPVPPSTDGGTPAPAPEPPADTPENDTPPPADSPAERFEEFCNENPGACG
jgi:hypothetical protein